MVAIDFCIRSDDISQYIAEIKSIKYLKNVKRYNISAYILDNTGKELPKAPSEKTNKHREISKFNLYITATNHLGNTFIQFPEYEIKIEHTDLHADTYKTFYTYLVSDKKDSDKILSLDFGIYRKPRVGANKKLESIYEIYIKSKDLEVEINGH